MSDLAAGQADSTPAQAALRLINAGRADDAVGVLGRFLAGQPTDVPALGLLSLAHLRAGRWADALIAADQAIGLEPGYLPAWQRRCIALIELDRMADAEVAAVEYLRLAPDEWHAHYTTARVLRARPGRRQAALSHARRAVELAPDDANAHNLLGVVHRALEDRPAAELAYRTALSIDPTHALARSNLALLTLGRAGTDEVMAGLREAAASDPQQSAIHRNMALLAVLVLVRGGTWLTLVDLMITWFVSAMAQDTATARLIVFGLVVVGWVGMVGWWWTRQRPYLRSLVPAAVGKLVRTSDAKWGMFGIVAAVACCLAALWWPAAGLGLVILGYVVQLAGSGTSRRMAARHRRQAAVDRA
ncbi:MAG TPA: tetratricopeptide repeat protein [Pseudonocardiaceae bacterium]|nr:tetratricopeptide repeat protein [Pseudonocardiaceae bacterium]